MAPPPNHSGTDYASCFSWAYKPTALLIYWLSARSYQNSDVQLAEQSSVKSFLCVFVTLRSFLDVKDFKLIICQQRKRLFGAQGWKINPVWTKRRKQNKGLFTFWRPAARRRPCEASLRSSNVQLGGGGSKGCKTLAGLRLCGCSDCSSREGSSASLMNSDVKTLLLLTRCNWARCSDGATSEQSARIMSHQTASSVLAAGVPDETPWSRSSLTPPAAVSPLPPIPFSQRGTTALCLSSLTPSPFTLCYFLYVGADDVIVTSANRTLKEHSVTRVDHLQHCIMHCIVPEGVGPGPRWSQYNNDLTIFWRKIREVPALK